MNQQYNEVPTIISTKDLSYLSDMFSWNFNAAKQANHFYEESQDEEIKAMIQKAREIHKQHTIAINNILE